MKKINNKKGFTLIEILAVMVILGILSTVAVVATSKYKQKAVQEGYDALAKSAYSAYEIYVMNHKLTKGTSVSLEKLEEEQLIDNLKDPGNKEGVCRGTAKSDGLLDDEDTFDVYLCCSNYNKHYIYGSSKSINDMNDDEIDDYCNND